MPSAAGAAEGASAPLMMKGGDGPILASATAEWGVAPAPPIKVPKRLSALAKLGLWLIGLAFLAPQLLPADIMVDLMPIFPSNKGAANV